jgi:hypothetical protein
MRENRRSADHPQKLAVKNTQGYRGCTLEWAFEAIHPAIQAHQKLLPLVLRRFDVLRPRESSGTIPGTPYSADTKASDFRVF